MPGGSVNGRPFRESVDSYSRTGIPCGNPRRYQSHDVVRMEPGVRSRSKHIDGPLEKIETEGQKQLKAMLQKQMETKVTVQQQLGQKREFSKGAEYRDSGEDLTGTRSLGDFLTHGEITNYIEEMKSYGLTHEEILYKLQVENEDSMSKKSKLSNPEFKDARLAEINEKIVTKKQALARPDSFSNIKPLSRHEMELENAISMANSQNKFLHKTLVKKREDGSSINPNDPMNCLPDILENLTKKGRTICSRNKRKKDKSYKKECTLECCNPSVETSCSKCSRSGTVGTESEACSSHDTSCDQCQQSCDQELEVQTCAERPVDYVPKEMTQNKKEKKLPQKSTCFIVSTQKGAKVSCHKTEETKHLNDNEKDKPESSENEAIDISGEIRVLHDVEAIPEDVIKQYKLSPDEVKKIPRFETYTPGESSNVLFVKNLSLKVTEEDLASLFINFQEDDENRIVFKLLNGRMKGQAFVTFSNSETASKALELVHGYDFKGKPVIVQYGKKSS